MIIIDTSVWIEFFKQNPAFTDEVVLLLESKMVVTIEPVFSELLYGAKNEKERNRILSFWKILPKVRFTEGSFLESAHYANINNIQNQGIGLIDAIISKAAIENGYKLWTLDKKLINSIGHQYIYTK